MSCPTLTLPTLLLPVLLLFFVTWSCVRQRSAPFHVLLSVLVFEIYAVTSLICLPR